MKKKENFIPIFVLLFIISAILFKTNFSLGFLEGIISPIQKITVDIFSLPKNIFTDDSKEDLKAENLSLVKKLIDQKELQKENLALRDQFKTTVLSSQNLLSAKIAGSPNFIPGVTSPDNFILDKGKNNGVKLGQAVIFKDNLVGKISKVSDNISEVILVINKQSSFAAKTQPVGGRASKTEALGVVKGYGNNEIILENVLLSDNLSNSDIVLTKGDINAEGIGYPANLIVGKIISIDKKASSLFQSAKIKNLIDFSRLSTVFIVVQY